MKDPNQPVTQLPQSHINSIKEYELSDSTSKSEAIQLIKMVNSYEAEKDKSSSLVENTSKLLTGGIASLKYLKTRGFLEKDVLGQASAQVKAHLQSGNFKPVMAYAGSTCDIKLTDLIIEDSINYLNSIRMQAKLINTKEVINSP